jgi:zinc protease
VTKRLLALVASVLLAGCAGPPARPLVPPLRYAGPDAHAPSENAPFRASPPALADEGPLPPVTVQSFALPGSLRVLVVERHGFPAIAAQLETDIGPADAGDVGGVLAGMLADVFLKPPEGVVQTSGGCGAVGCFVQSRGATGDLDDMLGRMADLVLFERAPAAEYDRRLATAIKLEEMVGEDPGRSLGRIEVGLLFGNHHAYGSSHKVVRPSLDDLRDLRRRAFVPASSVLIVVGDVTADEVNASAARRFGSWTAAAGQLPAPAPPPDATGARIAAFHTTVIRQVFGAVVARGPSRRDPDAPAFQLLVDMLGGSPGSIAFQGVREDMEAAYAVGSSVVWYPTTSRMSLGGSFERGQAIDGVQGLLDAIRGVRDAAPSEDALARAKRTAVSKSGRAFETNEGLAAMLAQTVLLGVTPEDAIDFPRKIRGVTSAQVQAVATRYLGLGQLHVVLVGDPEYLVTAQSLRLGAPMRTNGFGERWEGGTEHRALDGSF